MLLDRRRIRRWGKWIALLLAIVFAGGFLFLGVGYGGAGFNLSSIFTGKSQSPAQANTPQEKINAYEAQLQKNPKDVQALLGLATVYQENSQLKTAAAVLEQVLVVDPSQKDVYLRLANIYTDATVLDYQGAIRILNKATQVDPNNPDIYLKLGIVQNTMGNKSAAVLAWNKYLQLAPNGDNAQVVKDEIAKLTAPTTTTTAGSTATTGAGSSTTAGGSTSTTAGAATTTTALTTTTATAVSTSSTSK